MRDRGAARARPFPPSPLISCAWIFPSCTEYCGTYCCSCPAHLLLRFPGSRRMHAQLHHHRLDWTIIASPCWLAKYLRDAPVFACLLACVTTMHALVIVGADLPIAGGLQCFDSTNPTFLAFW